MRRRGLLLVLAFVFAPFLGIFFRGKRQAEDCYCGKCEWCKEDYN